MENRTTYADLTSLRNTQRGEHVYIIGKGPSLAKFRPFTQFDGKICLGINNVYQYFPHCTHIFLWHREVYDWDRVYLEHQNKFVVYYSSFHGLPSNLSNATNLKYCGDFPLAGREFATLAYWREHADEWMFKTTFATAVKFAWWLGATRITLVGCDFSLEKGYTADDSILEVPTTLRNYTREEIFALQYQVFEHLCRELVADGVLLERILSPEELT